MWVQATVYDTGRKDQSRKAQQYTYVFSESIRRRYYGEHPIYSKEAKEHLEDAVNDDYNMQYIYYIYPYSLFARHTFNKQMHTVLIMRIY
jgi:hypothetical protein